MRVVIIAQYSPNLFPALHQIAAALTERRAEVYFLSGVEPTETGVAGENIHWSKIPPTKGIWARLPWFRSNGPFIFRFLRRNRPEWIVAQHEYLVPALVYRATMGRNSRVAAYFADYHGDRRYLGVVGRLAGLLDAYVDICDVRLRWRKAAWPTMRANSFVIRQAPYRRAYPQHEPHEGPARVVFTGSRYVLGLDRNRLSRFLDRLCRHGTWVDWYLPGAEEVRASARSLLSHPLFRVRDPVEKRQLMETLGRYDAGLHWAPMAEEGRDPDYFNSAASNKIGEYIAAGLVVAHAGNPGLAYLPDDVCAVFDPTDPEAGADQLAAQLSDRATIEHKRQAALRYHLDEMNFEAQAAPFIQYIMAEAAGKSK